MRAKKLQFFFNTHPSVAGDLRNPHYVVGPPMSKCGGLDDDFLRRKRFVGIYVRPSFMRHLDAMLGACGLLDTQEGLA